MGFRGTTASFRTLGSAATTHNLFTAEVGVGTGKVLLLKELVASVDMSVALATCMPQVVVSRPAALPSGGTELVKVAINPTGVASETGIKFRGATASDGAAATAITATASTSVVWRRYAARLHTEVGQVVGMMFSLLPMSALTDPIVIRPGGSLLVQVVGINAADNPATNHWSVCCSFEEAAV